jgi:hypothetical protein
MTAPRAFTTGHTSSRSDPVRCCGACVAGFRQAHVDRREPENEDMGV